MSNPAIRILAPAIAVALLAACSGQKATQVAPPPPEVKVVALAPRTVSLTRELPGRTSPFVVAEVRPQATGIVESLNFTEGALVKAGQPLYTLDDDTLRADVGAAR